MNLKELQSINCTFENCSIFPAGASPAEVLTFFEGHKGEIIHPHWRHTHPDPLSVVHRMLEATNGSSWSGVSLRHPTLQPEVYDYVHASEHGYDPLSRPGGGGLSYIPETRTMNLHQNVDFPDADSVKAVKVVRVGIGLLQFLNHFAPLLKPAYAYIAPVFDPEFDPLPSDAFRETGTVCFLCWANYFGPAIVEQVGADFLREAPGWRIVELPCGGFLHVITQSFLDWQFGKHRAYVQHFRQVFPQIEEL